MERIHFNPISLAISLAVGWFFVSFLQTAVRSLLAASWTAFGTRYLEIALFKNGGAVAINFVVIVLCGIVGTAIFFLARK